MIEVPDAASIATIRKLEHLIDRKCGASTGTNLWAVFQLISEMKARKETGSIVTLICDGGERYTNTYFNEEWVEENGLCPDAHSCQLDEFFDRGIWSE